VVELGCGSGLLTRHLVERVTGLATDASPAMLEIAREMVGDAEDIRRLVLPDDPSRLPTRSSRWAMCSILPSAEAIDRAPVAAASAETRRCWRSTLRPGVRRARRDAGERRMGGRRLGDRDAVLETVPDRFVRQMATFVRNDDGSWRRDDERHDNVPIDGGGPALLAEHGVHAAVRASFGSEDLPPARAVVGSKAPSGT
jgi:SAM-dependent methyltransferase